ncbi:MAG: hypothetical protein WEB53_01240 [Akkermansiaceae bacterium]
MRKALAITGVIILVACGLWMANQSRGQNHIAATSSSRIQSERTQIDAESVIALPLRTKARNREAAGPRATHAPSRLKEFMLPPIAIKELDLQDALRKLMTHYEDACRKSGEAPLPLTFDIPPAAPRKLTLQLAAGNFNTSVQLLATLAGMKVSRKDREYRFEPLSDERRQLSRDLKVSPNFNRALSDMAGLTTPIGTFESDSPHVLKPLREHLTLLGLDLDPSTQVSLGASANLTLETTSAADAAAISELARAISEQPPTQLKFSSKIVELPAASTWTPPDGSQMTETEVLSFMRQAAQQKGTSLITMPSVTARNGQSSEIEQTREFIYQTDDVEETFETRNVGKALNFKGDLLGFGQEVGITYKDTTVDFDPATGNQPLFSSIAIAGNGFAHVGGTRLTVHTRPDGSKTVLLVTPELIDATGRPVHCGK